MRRLMVMMFVLAALGSAPRTHAEQNLGSANYMLPLCKTWLKVGDKDVETMKNIFRTDAVGRLISAGMCAGVVAGILETMRMFELSCPPKGVTNDQLVRMVVTEIERHPEKMHEDFIVPASAVMMLYWPCRK
jgi:hypothetical protein